MKLALAPLAFLVSVIGLAEDPWKILEPHFRVPEKFENDFGEFKRIEKSREDLAADWHEMLGKWPPLNENPKTEILKTERRENFTQHQIRFEWLPDQMTTAYLLIPDRPDKTTKLPAVVTVFYEPETAIGLGTSSDRDFALQLTRKGFVTLSIGTTETTQNRTYALYHPNRENAELQPLSALACAAANAWHVLADRPEVDENRIGITGHSYGGKWALFAGALWEKFAAVAVSDPGIVFDTHPSVNYWEPWYLGYHRPPWRKRGVPSEENPMRGLYPELLKNDRDLHELHLLICPRPFFVSGGAVDPPERWRVLNHSVEKNSKLGFENRVGMTNRPDHSPDPESNRVLVAFFEYFLENQDQK